MKTLLAIAVILLAGILALGFNNSDMAFRQVGAIDTTPSLRTLTPLAYAVNVSSSMDSMLKLYPAKKDGAR